MFSIYVLLVIILFCTSLFLLVFLLKKIKELKKSITSDIEPVKFKQHDIQFCERTVINPISSQVTSVFARYSSPHLQLHETSFSVNYDYKTQTLFRRYLPINITQD